MNHHVNFAVEYEVLNKGIKQKINTQLEMKDIEIVVSDRGMAVSKHKVPFKSFVRNFAVTLAKFFAPGDVTVPIYNAYGASVAASSYMKLVDSSPYASNMHVRRGIFIGDKGANSINSASLFSVLAGASSASLVGKVGLTSAMQNNITKTDTWLKRRLESVNASVAGGKIRYGESVVTIVDNSTIKVTRRIYNNSAATVKINEVGLGTIKETGGTATLRKIYLLARDAMAYDVNLGSGQYMDITYTFSLITNGYLTRNFITLLANFFNNSLTAYNYIAENAVSDTVSSKAQLSQVPAITDDTKGIQIGSSNEYGISIEDYRLEDWYQHDAITGIAYGEQTYIEDIDAYNTTTRFGFSRDFTNNSSNSKEVNEGAMSIYGDANKCIVLARFPINSVVLNPNDTLRVKVYFDFPVSNTTYVTQES